MPNWCSNTIYLDHNKDELIRAENALKRGEFMEEFLPMPEGEDWLRWRTANWGTKWDVEADMIEYKDSTLIATYDSAWSPPIMFYHHLRRLGFEVKALYFEPDQEFCGIFEDGHDGYYQLSNLSGKEVKDLIPKELEVEFGILGYLTQSECEDSESEDK